MPARPILANEIAQQVRGQRLGLSAAILPCFSHGDACLDGLGHGPDAACAQDGRAVRTDLIVDAPVFLVKAVAQAKRKQRIGFCGNIARPTTPPVLVQQPHPFELMPGFNEMAAIGMSSPIVRKELPQRARCAVVEPFVEQVHQPVRFIQPSRIAGRFMQRQHRLQQVHVRVLVQGAGRWLPVLRSLAVKALGGEGETFLKQAHRLYRVGQCIGRSEGAMEPGEGE